MLGRHAARLCLRDFGGRHLFITSLFCFAAMLRNIQIQKLENTAVVWVVTGQRSRSVGSQNLRKANVGSELIRYSRSEVTSHRVTIVLSRAAWTGWMDYRLSCFYHFFQQIFCLGLKNTLVALLLLVCRRQSRFLAHRRCFAIFGWLWCAEGGIEDGSACILMLHKILLEISLLIDSQLCPLIHKIASEDFPFFPSPFS